MTGAVVRLKKRSTLAYFQKYTHVWSNYISLIIAQSAKKTSPISRITETYPLLIRNVLRIRNVINKPNQVNIFAMLHFQSNLVCQYLIAAKFFKVISLYY